jgi:predicted secreted hydrolase
MHTIFILLLCLVFQSVAFSAPPVFSPVVPDKVLEFPRDFGSHPDYRIEWWYATGWLKRSDGSPLGFQITFFRIATSIDVSNPSGFAPKQLIVAHAALSDPKEGKLLHDQKIRREGFDLAYARTGNTDVKLDGWTFYRETDGRYRAHLDAQDFTLHLTLTPTQPLMLQGEEGFSRKGPKPEQASYYYSEPHLQVTGTISRKNEVEVVTGTAWLDHEWSSELIDPDAAGWDWVGANLADGSALVAFQMRGKQGGAIWAYAALRDVSGHMTIFTPNEVSFHPERSWRSPRTRATYPVEICIKTGEIEWRLTPLMDDQELDSRASIDAVYWEGAVTITRDGKPAGRGYLELTGYLQALTF